MALNARAQAACLLLLLFASLASTSLLQASQLADPQSHGNPEAFSQTDLNPVVHRLWKRDSHFPICVFCCNCCGKSCGICCKT